MWPWIDYAKYPYSAAKVFLKSLLISDVSFPCTGFYTGEHIFDECEKEDIEGLKPGEIKNLDPWYLAEAFEKWAKCFRIGYEDGTVVFDFDNGFGDQRACLKISMDWEKWTAELFGKYVEIGYELFYDTYMADGSHPEIEEMSWHTEFKGGELIFKDYDGKEIFKKTPQEFIEDIAEATRKRWDRAFKNWIFILHKNGGLILALDKYDELKRLMAESDVTIEAQYHLLRKGHAEPDSQQIEVKVELPNGEALYGVAKDDPENPYFLKSCLGSKKEINDYRHNVFELPLPIYNCYIY